MFVMYILLSGLSSTVFLISNFLIFLSHSFVKQKVLVCSVTGALGSYSDILR